MNKLLINAFLFYSFLEFLLFALAQEVGKIENRTDRKHILLVNTTSGLIRGVEEVGPNGKPIYKYLGIPFAEPPTGKRRFLPPVPVTRRDGILLANKKPNSCTQNSYMGVDFLEFLKPFALPTNISEDCLYLNVYRPTTEFNVPKNGRSVMIWLYGGAFTKGTISYPLYDGSTLASEEGVIVVAISYRVTAFGYLYLDHPGIPGNAGLYDQLQGITWVKDNIAAFGGDPNSITVFGESAGASSTALLIVSPESHGLFHRGILESGSATVPWATLEPNEALRRGLVVASELGCLPATNETRANELEVYWKTKANSYVKEATVSCLLSVNAEVFLEHEPYVVDGCSFAPIVDGRILPKSPMELLRDRTDITKSSNQAHPMQLLMGTNTNEGTLFFVYMLPDVFSVFEETAFLERNLFDETIRQFSPYKTDAVLRAVKFFYADWKEFSQSLPTVPKDNDTSVRIGMNFADPLDELVGDYFFTCRMKDMANAIASSFRNIDLLDEMGLTVAGPSAYIYRYEHRSSTSLFPAWTGVFHSHEIGFVFGEPLHVGPTAPKFTNKEKLFSRRIQRMWANFARTGDPNISPDGKEDLLYNVPKWPKYTVKGQDYLKMDATNITPAANLRARECLLWDSYLPSLLKLEEQFNKTIAYYKSYVDTLTPTKSLDKYLEIMKTKQHELDTNSVEPYSFGNPLIATSYLTTICVIIALLTFDQSQV